MKSERLAVGDHEITKRQRYREIVAVLTRHGFGVVDDRMVKHETKEQARAEHLRLACEELGTLFIKLGQVLSTRSDILPPAYRAELAKMQDDVPPLPTELIAEVIEEDLRAAPAAIFSRFNDTPLGSASIGQVHAARLTDGREVVVKVRKPGIDPQASFSDYLRPMIEKMILQEAKQELSRVRDSALDAIELGLELPERLERVLAQLERGNLQVWARTPDADALMQRLERLAARINATILAAALVVGLAIVMLVYRPHGWHTWIGVVFWIVVVVATAAVARALWRLRK